ncbi:hypothetical protein METBIDRAFT_12490 [Metschnikowia bicuspidata var. bicuspidata NRRL YB-4993]|uniref:Uncharacterized protein n=1 Tax=Metschnikowia bicuspidata var. bicuspidata NRRL YB-4993 TaxID=869754 RepID=A0A1A0H8Q4_9ASCO|nr:hypothetical protein METBIDRAFT_12490 [Metschnikowia bicuspidata var. bicuspidata NRRL YB-4993]OBA20499.1 hypothetical protein METBIDRAFT_12490 [Metschnikowia bicuspidata var. bicuspidata NRRL YB-4993]
MYMREVGPATQGVDGRSRELDALQKHLCSPDPGRFQEALDLMERLGHEGLGLQSTPVSRALAHRTNTEYDKTHSLFDCSDVTSVDTCGQFRDTDRDSDLDETASLMECGEAMHANLDSSGPGPGGSPSQFNLYEFLDGIQTRHVTISSKFQETHAKLDVLRHQNRLDADLLAKLSANNELMHEKIHGLKTEVSDMFHDLHLLKTSRERGGPPGCRPNPTYTLAYTSLPDRCTTISDMAKTDSTTVDTHFCFIADSEENDRGKAAPIMHCHGVSKHPVASQSASPHSGTLSTQMDETTQIHSIQFDKAPVGPNMMPKYAKEMLALFVLLLAFWLALSWHWTHYTWDIKWMQKYD